MCRPAWSRPATSLVVFFITLPALNARSDEGRWVGTWAASPQLTEPANMPPEPGLADTTLRQVVRVSLGGKRLRVRFSNAFGTKPLTLLSVHVARSAGGAAVEPGSAVPLTFGGRTSVTIPTGAPMISDAADFDLLPLSDLAVTIRVKDSSKAVTGHPGARCTSYLQDGDVMREPDLPKAARTPHWYYLCGVDVEHAEASAVAVLGDSITDGRGSPIDGNGRWTDHLARSLNDGGRGGVGVLNQGARRQPRVERRVGSEYVGKARPRCSGATRSPLAGRPGRDQRSGYALGDSSRSDRRLRPDHRTLPRAGYPRLRRDDPALRGLLVFQPGAGGCAPRSQRLDSRLRPLRRCYRLRRRDPEPAEASAALGGS